MPLKRLSENVSTGRPLSFECYCGATVHPNGPGQDFDCHKCNRSFNSAGQELADRSQWGEETGEQACDFDQGNANPERAFDENF